MKQMIYGQKFFRNDLTEKQQNKIRSTSFAIIGLGGTGGFILENLLRTGAENLLLFDHDRFEYSNFNRQMLATEQSLDLPKTKAAIARARLINRSAKIKAKSRFDSDLGGAGIVIDGSDNVETRIAIARSARKERIPYVFCSASGSRGMVTVFDRYSFEKAFQTGSKRRHKGCSSILCTASSLAGSLAASQAINRILKKPYVKAPDALFFDLNKKEIFWRAELG